MTATYPEISFIVGAALVYLFWIIDRDRNIRPSAQVLQRTATA